MNIPLMKHALLMFFSLLALKGYSQNPTQGNEQFKLIGKIIHKVTLSPPCQNYMYGTVVELKIIHFSDKSYEKDTIAVVVTCPETAGKGFYEMGNTYEFTMTDHPPENHNWIIPNDAILEKYQMKKRFFVISYQKK